MKRKISLVLLTAILLTSALFALTGCDGLPFGKKSVPVYEGMTLSSAIGGFADQSGGAYLESADAPEGEEDTYGQLVGDHTGNLPVLDSANPFPANGAGKNIETAIQSSLRVEGTESPIFSASVGDSIYVNVHINNPGKFEISALTFNGLQYNRYMFEKSSTTSTIVLKVVVGEAMGVVDYSISDIKYLDGKETKDVIMEGDTTVSLGVNAKNGVTASIKSVNAGATSLTLNTEVSDPYSLIALSGGKLKAVVYDGKRIVAEKDIAIGTSSVTFDSLDQKTVYQYAIVGYYDDFSGSGFGMHILAKDAIYTQAILLFDNVEIGQEGVSFGFRWYEGYSKGSISSIEVYRDGQLVKHADSYTIDGLLSGKTYKVVAKYHTGSSTESIYIEFTTLPKALPSLIFNTPACSQTSVRYGFFESDPDNIGTITSVELLLDGKVVMTAVDADRKIFENLSSDTPYTLRATYVYDLNDGNGSVTVVKTAAAKTAAKAEPLIDIRDLKPSVNGVDAIYTIDDPTCAITSYKVELYKGSTLVSAYDGNVGEIHFSSLEQYTEYTVKVTYSYSMNNGTEQKTRVAEEKFRTLPYIDVKEFIITNTEAVSYGDIISVRIELDNPTKTPIKSVVISGVSYEVVCNYDASRAYASILCNGQFGGGSKELVLDKVNADVDGAIYTFAPSESFSGSIFINGELTLLDFKIVSGSYEQIAWAFPSDKVYALITLDNPSGYTVESINGITEIIKLDDSRWCYELTLARGWNSISLSSIAYSVGTVSRTLELSELGNPIFRVTSDEVRYVSKASDLLSMNGGYYYELAADIDLADIKWQGKGFFGVLNGKGYSIKNLTFTDTVSTDAYLGLFSVGTGIIENVKLESASIVTDLRTEAGSTRDAYCGGLVAYSEGMLSLGGCSIDSSSSLDVKADDKAYVGGLVGYASTGSTVTFTDCSSAASINGNVSDLLIGFSTAKN